MTFSQNHASLALLAQRMIGVHRLLTQVQRSSPQCDNIYRPEAKVGGAYGTPSSECLFAHGARVRTQ